MAQTPPETIQPEQEPVAPGAVPAEPAPGPLGRVLGFFDSATKVIVTVTGLVVAVGGAWAAVTSFGSDGDAHPAANSSSGTSVTAEIDACERTHGLSQQHQQVTITIGLPGFARCDWPAPRYADADGFSEIGVKTVDRLDLPESSDADEVDQISGTCATFLVTYDWRAQGAGENPIPAVIPAGTVTSMDDPTRPYTDHSLDVPARDQAYFVRNNNVAIVAASCQD